ncbi:hypothetical protein [Aeribacillus sp. FSL K6-2833]|uniref:hypothetical protein n=1 Tax=Aeribacillus sp. FSL K6-2833 TaxID=2954611 RepID=UPI0030D8323C
MVEFNHPSISIKRQAQLLGIHRTSVYRQSKGQTESSENIMLMHEMDMLVFCKQKVQKNAAKFT